MEDKVKIALHINPGAAGNEVVGLVNNTWRLKIAAAPVKGRANRELVSFLSEVLGIAKSRINIVSGRTARDKIIAITGLQKNDIVKRLLPGASREGRENS